MKKLLLTTVIGTCLAASTMHLAAQVPMQGLDAEGALGKPMVIAEHDMLYAEPFRTEGFLSMQVKIIAVGGGVVFEDKSDISSMSVMLKDLDLPNGSYRYEVNTFYLSNEATSVTGEAGATSRGKIGRFEINNGLIEQRADPVGDELSLVEPPSLLMRMAGTAIGWLVPSAQAADLTASSSIPVLWWDDTDDACCEWRISAPNDGTNNTWSLEDYVGNNLGHDVISIFGDNGSTQNEDSLIVDAAGDITLAGGAGFIDKSANQMFIGGGTTPTFGGSELEVHDTVPQIMLFDTTDSTTVAIELVTDLLGLVGKPSAGSFRNIFQMNVNAPGGSLFIDADGKTGFGTSSPSSTMHITRNDKSTQLKITDTSATIGNTNLMQLENTGGAQIGFKDTTRSYQWNFIGGRDFKINATTYAGTEFEVTREGNLNILGVLSENSDVTAKENIVPIDRQNVLDKIANLPISEWSYIDTPKERHIGPMAQDFHAAFGLGHSETLIATLDTAGVALAGIQALLEENTALKERLAKLEEQQSHMQDVMVQLLEAQQSQPVLTSIANN